MRVALATLLLAPLAASAQDMPLLTILKDGEGWKKGEGKKPKSAPTTTQAGKKPNCTVLSADGTTLFVGWEVQSHIWAYTALENGNFRDGDPYAELRSHKGYDYSREGRDKWKNDPWPAVTALAVDADGRIYAATPQDLQIFDPTGRLCGVVSLPADGRPDHLGWEGKDKDALVLWIGDQKWTRKLQARGK